MAKITERVWFRKGRRGALQKRSAFGFTAIGKDGKQVRRSNESWSRDDAEKALAAFLLDIAPAPTPAIDGPGLTFGQVIEQYLAAKSRKKSIAGDRRHFELLKSVFGAGTPLADITAAKISAWKAERLNTICKQTGQPYSAASVNRPLAALRHLLRLASREWEVLAWVPTISLQKEPNGRLRFLTDEEQVRLLAECEKANNRELKTIVLTLLHTGGRRNEVLGLTWESGVDFARGIVTFHGTKTEKSRSVPMTKAVYEALSALPGPREGRVFKTRSIRTGFENACRRAGLVDFHIHDLRHTFASQLVQRGATLQAVKELLGHSSLAMTMRYAHLSPAHLRQAVELLEGPAQISTQIAHELVEGADAETLAGSSS